MNLKCREASEWNSPPQLRRGGRDIKKNAAKPPLMERTGWCWSTKCIWFINTTPSARAKVASRLFLNRAATPPHLRRGVPFGCFATFIEKSAHPEFLDVRRSDVRFRTRSNPGSQILIGLGAFTPPRLSGVGGPLCSGERCLPADDFGLRYRVGSAQPS